jgi:peptidoglycan/xylan/chitin deacetylase (PgdA/CDA1 family)
MPVLVSFTMDNLGDAADLYRGVIKAPRPPGSNPPLEQGYPALLDLFARFDIPLTCFIEGWSARQYPDYIQRVLDHGHEIGMHGWTHERWAELPNADVLELATRATDSIRQATGKAPRTFRAPGGKSTPYTTDVLGKLGYTIDASYTDSHVGAQLSRTLTSLPYQWSGVDATHWLWNSRSGAETERRWQAALDEAAASNTPYVFIWHPHVMGIDPARLDTGARTLAFVRNDPRFEIVPLETMRRHVANSR